MYQYCLYYYQYSMDMNKSVYDPLSMIFKGFKMTYKAFKKVMKELGYWKAFKKNANSKKASGILTEGAYNAKNFKEDREYSRDFLLGAFVWCATPKGEGWRYWDAVADNVSEYIKNKREVKWKKHES